MKIYTSDPVCPYKATKINPFQTRAEIEGLLARWGIKKTAWDFDPDNDLVILHFQFTENIHGVNLNPIMKIEPPHIWDKGNRNKKEKINWMVSLRVLYWYLKTHLEYIYLGQSEKTMGLLPYVETPDGKTLKDMLLPRLTKEGIIPALENREEEVAQFQKVQQ